MNTLEAFFDGELGLIAEQSASGKNNQTDSFELIRQSTDSGANVIKFQTYHAEEMTTMAIGKKIKHGLWQGVSLMDLYEKGQPDLTLQDELISYCSSQGIRWFSSPFGSRSLSFLEDRHCSVYKIASLESTDVGFLREVIGLRKPIILSTGAKTIDEISTIFDLMLKEADSSFALMHCICDYPTPERSLNLNVINQFKERFGCQVGFSDHSTSLDSGAVAVGCGATIFEKHVTLQRSAAGLDDGFALRPAELSQYFSNILNARDMMGFCRGSAEFPNESKNRAYRRGLYFSRNLSEGQRITDDDIVSFRPCVEMDAIFRDKVVGRAVTGEIKAGDPVAWSFLD